MAASRISLNPEKLPMKQCLTMLAAAACAVACAAAAAQAPDVIRFDIDRFDVRGNTLLPQAEVTRLLAPHAGRQRDFGDVQRALEALNAAYQAAGYKLVTVELPEQELERGVVQLNVVATVIGRIRVEGNRHFDAANLRRSLPQLRAGETPHMDRLSANLKLANDNPAKKVTMKLQSGQQEAQADVLLDVADENPWSALLNADNSGSGSTGKTQVGVVLQHANLFGRDHVASLQYTTSAEEPGRVKVYGLGYHVPLYALGDALDLYASYSNIDSGIVTAGILNLAVSGKGAVAGARYTHNLARRGDYESRLQYGVDYKAFKNSVLLLGAELGNDVTVHPLSVAYSGNWTLPKGDAGVAATLLRNVPGGSRGGQADFTRARSGARDDYTILRLSGSYSRALPAEWLLRAVANAQLTNDALIPGEQFGAGGAASVRGFAEREVSNDAGVNANLELYTPNLCGQQRWNCRVLAFVDAAHARRNHALAGELEKLSISSAGLGLRLAMASNLNLQLDYGRVLSGGAVQRDGGRLHLRLGLAY
jgi:hemolysin activation/secretion protein